MKPTILFYDPSAASWSGKLRQLCAIQGVRLRPVSDADLSRTVSALANGLQAETAPPGGAPISEPVLVFCGVTSSQLDRLLISLGKAGARGCLKAVLTPHNAQWTFRALYEELVKERLQMP